jgi:hypothetical protein
MTEASVIFALLAAAALTLSLWLSAYLTHRAVLKVIGIFCRNKALRFQDAKTIEELELTPPNLLQRVTQMRDYKPYALKILTGQGIINRTPDGKLYLSEEKLNPNMRCNDLLVLPR